MAVQTSYSIRPPVGLLGERYSGGSGRAPWKALSALARGYLKAGYGAFKVPGVGGQGVVTDNLRQAYHQPDPGAAADADAFLTTTATSTSAVSSTTFNGAEAGAEIFPPRRITVTLSTEADFLETDLTITFPNEDGISVTETLAVPAGGNATLTTTAYASGAPTAYTLEAQDGTAGSYTIGLAAIATLTIADFLGIVIRDPYKEKVNDGVDSFEDNEVLSLCRMGSMMVFTEEAVSDMDPVYVRIASGAGGSVLGAFRNDADSSSCVLVPGARFVYNSDAGIAPVDLGMGW